MTRSSSLGFHFVFVFFWTTEEEREKRGFMCFIFSGQIPARSQHVGCKHCKRQPPFLYDCQSSWTSLWVSQSLLGGSKFQDVGICLQQSKMTWKTACYFWNKHSRTACKAQRRTAFSYPDVDGDIFTVRLLGSIGNWGEFDRAASFIIPWPDRQTDRSSDTCSSYMWLLKWLWGPQGEKWKEMQLTTWIYHLRRGLK